MDYQQLNITVADPQQREILIALLGEAGYEAFEEQEAALLAYIPADRYDAASAAEIAAGMQLAFTTERVEQQNWNARWEADFQPMEVPQFCTVRAHFHQPEVMNPYEIIITPKMSFGTGHHATTRLMMEGLRDYPPAGATVLDFGTGTGILAILAAKMGATTVLAIDTDEWSVENAQENTALNAVGGIAIRQGSLEAAEEGTYDLILANINRHILLEYMERMSGLLRMPGRLMLSGILTEDEAAVSGAAVAHGLIPEDRRELNNWLSLSFVKQEVVDASKSGINRGDITD